jgi:hypothetical protein
MAKPMPMLPPPGARIAVLIPISSPLRFSSAPPELPRLIEASVWMKFSSPSRFRPLRPRAEIMPEVAVWPRPNGLPTATAKSPTRSLSESAMAICVRLPAFQLQQSDIALFIAADQFGIKFTAIVQLDADLLRLIDDVIIGQHVAFRCVDDDAGAQPFKRLRLLCGALSPKYFFSSSGILSVGEAVPSTCTLTTAGRTFPASAPGLVTRPGRAPESVRMLLPEAGPTTITQCLTLTHSTAKSVSSLDAGSRNLRCMEKRPE